MAQPTPVTSQSQSQSLEPCKFPSLNKAFAAPDVRFSSTVDCTSESSIQLQQYCEKQQITLDLILQATWALVLKSYVGSDSTLFGYRGGSSKDNGVICGNHFGLSDPLEKHLARSAETETSTISTAASWSCVQLGSEHSTQDLFNSLLTFKDECVMSSTEAQTSEEVKAYLHHRPEQYC